MSRPSLIARLLFVEAGSLIRIGRTRPLTDKDVLPLPDEADPFKTGDEYDKLNLDSFVRFILGAFFATGAPARRLLLLTCTTIALGLSTPLLLHSLLTQLGGYTAGNDDLAMLFATAIALGSAGILKAVAQQHWYYNALVGFASMIAGIDRRVFDHTVRLRRSARVNTPTGDLVNHVASDSYAIGEASFFIPELLNSVLTTAGVLTLLWWYLGPATLASLAVLVVLVPLTRAIGRRYRRLDHVLMETRDERVSLMSQILNGVRVMKYYAWEDGVRREISDVRQRELATKYKVVSTDAASTLIFIAGTTIVAFAGFATFVLMGYELTIPLVFACLTLFANLEEPFGMFSHLIANLQHARVATSRLRDLFAKPAEAAIDERPRSPRHQAVGLELEGLSVQFAEDPQPVLQSVTLTIRPGEAVALVGAVGAGKSTLLMAMAGLQDGVGGTLRYTNVLAHERPRIAWAPQEAFTMNASLANNITFNEPCSPDVLHGILHDCALNADVQQLPAGLETEIGERGVNLSGGQKQRVALARAAYDEPGIVFLDDPLSAVDVHTEEVLVENLLFGRWKDITRVVVTHRLDHLDRFDRVFVVENGTIRERRTENGELRTENEAAPLLAAPLPAAPLLTAPSLAAPLLAAPTTTSSSRVTDDEDRETGAVSLDVYDHYARAMTSEIRSHRAWWVFVLVGSTVLVTFMPMLQNAWFARGWSDAWSAVLGYGAIGLLVLLSWYVSKVVWMRRTFVAGQRIHDAALSGVLRAPIRFFDSTPSGRILNRFARDMEGVDDHLSWNIDQSIRSLTQTLGALVLIITVMPLMLLVIVPVLLIYWRLQREYRTAAREAKRLESISRSPVFAHFKEMATGLFVIRAFAREETFRDTFLQNVWDMNQRWFCSIMLNRWFSTRVPLLSGLISIGASVAVVLAVIGGWLTPGFAGLVLTYSLGFWGTLNWAVRAFSEVESRMTNVERLRHYATIAPEPDVTRQRSEPLPEKWPATGAVEFRDVCVRYAPHLPLVLNGVSFSVPGGAKVGIIGRTGAGKSTLFQSLFRFVELTSGSILIDGVDIASVPLHELRTEVAIIPQDPTLFLGSIRGNLDRYGVASDAEIWRALERVHMRDAIEALPNGLDAAVVENGLNFSQGQRQLLCMARAVLTGARIIVLDEATASVDVRTDALIQETVRTEFKDVTVLIIAHRLNTVEACDLVVELAHGKVVRLTQPSEIHDEDLD
jgi:ABC-type multidrug transport system fused ATPase/permease subunit